MARLEKYLTILFAKEASGFFFVAAFLVWITQTLRLFDLVTAKGQDMITLLGQSLLTTPPLALAIIYVCMGVALARVLGTLQNSRELHTVHSSARTSALVRSIVLFACGGVLTVSLLSHWIEPYAQRAYAQWSEQVAADVVGRALSPHRFSEVVPGLVIVISGRNRDGTVTGFFADDTRDSETRRTYVAERAIIVIDDDGYNLSLEDGAIQYIREQGQFTEVAFSRYELSLERFTQQGSTADTLGMQSSATILANHGLSGFSGAPWHELNRRLAEASRVIAICLFVAALAAFPHAGRGGRRMPMELIVLIVGLGDRAASEIFQFSTIFGPHIGAVAVSIIAFVLLIPKLSGRRRVGPRKQTA